VHQFSLPHAGREKEPIQLRLGGLERRQPDHPDLASASLYLAAGADDCRSVAKANANTPRVRLHKTRRLCMV
jgi:hypothetical protein